MNLALQQKLFASYPGLFRRLANEHEVGGPLDYWGIECGDGWFSIIDTLSSQLEAEISCLDAQCRACWPRAIQVKEKLGSLRFYVSGRAQLSPEMLAAIEIAENLSSRTCECCGDPGVEIRNMAEWIHVACDRCEQARQDRINAGTSPYTSAEMDQQLAELRHILDGRPL